ncbi:MAG: tRNA-dihydrouridine synthase family protein [Lachnospiraceae bacterium]|nr:tRNA-dihydrouridine synthase family protein [Lachnospiraceae bacterium]
MKRIYMAPMEGLTTRIYRHVFARHYSGVDKCFTPFLSPNQNHSFQKKELDEIDPEINKGLTTVPQILCSVAEHSVWALREIAELGYSEVNFNLGCPSGTVVTKKKGSGFLPFPWEIDAFFDEVFREADKLRMKISVKTRLGRNDAEEFIDVLDVYNKYPFSEVIVHPRIQKDFYREPVRPEWFEYTLSHSNNPVCYNGDLFTAEDIRGFEERHPDVGMIMLGRGIIARPFLPEEMTDETKDRKKLKAFHDELVFSYYDVTHDDHCVLAKMKEVWEHMGPALSVEERTFKSLRKSKKINEYKAITDSIF